MQNKAGWKFNEKKAAQTDVNTTGLRLVNCRIPIRVTACTAQSAECLENKASYEMQLAESNSGSRVWDMAR
jgi:hypothetical protein